MIIFQCLEVENQQSKSENQHIKSEKKYDYISVPRSRKSTK